MSEKRFRTNDLVKFNYSEIKEYVDEKHTPTPLRNDEVCKLLNEQQATITELKETIKSVEKQLEDNYHLEIEDGYVVPSMKDIAKDYFDLLLEDAKREFGDLKYVQDGKVIDDE